MAVRPSWVTDSLGFQSQVRAPPMGEPLGWASRKLTLTSAVGTTTTAQPPRWE